MARCASCSYPLTIIDSIVCYECSSYFHIDCAQLVGFPYYELSSDPSRNTFHCSTCKILPLPRRRSDSDSESDAEVDSTMPSRQLDYQLEGEADLAKILNELQGNVQDVSDLCKGMLREINDLKSVNLTLRCCIENLRHDNEKRDCVISELKYRLDALERNRTSNRINTECLDWDEIREGETERYLTPEPECLTAEKSNVSFSKSYSGIIPDYRTENFQTEDELLQRIISEENNYGTSGKEEEDPKEATEVLKLTSTIKESRNDNQEFETDSSEKEESISTEEPTNFDFNREINAEELTNIQQGRQDWDWKGSEAIEVEKLVEEQSEEEESESETSQVEEEDTPGWEILEEEIQSKPSSKVKDQTTESSDNICSSKREDEDEDDDEEIDKDESEETHGNLDTEQITEKDDNDETSYSTITTKKSVVEQKTSYFETESTYHTKGEEGDASRDQETPIPEEAPEDGAEEKEDVEEQLRYTGENDEETVPEELEGGVVDDPTVLEGEPRLDGEEEVGLEGEGTLKPEASEGEQGVEGEPLGGQSLEQEEVQPTEPQPPPLPVHTEEDLWFYLKETVSSVHPATVEEFVQNLIGTLQHVPEEYLKPVIDANIKRATSPCVADDEHPDIQEGVSLAEGEDALPDGSVPIESLEGGTTVSGEVLEVTSEIAGDSVTPEVPSEVPNDPASPEETADGFSSVEAAA